MRLELVLPAVPARGSSYTPACPYPDCCSLDVRLHQMVRKSFLDRQEQTIALWRYQCHSCWRTFRSYPPGTSAAHTAQRMHALAILLYGAGFSYRATAEGLAALGVSVSKSGVYDAVQDVVARSPGIIRGTLFNKVRLLPADAGSTQISYMTAAWLTVNLSGGPGVDLVLNIEGLPVDHSLQIEQALAPWVAAVGATLVISP